MNSPRQHEMNKLQAIDSQRLAIEQRLDHRLPLQRRQLAALVCATKWRLAILRRCDPSTYTHELVDATVKKLRMEIGAFEYATKEQSEMLTRTLFQLDDILSHGDVAIKDARKALVLSIQRLLEHADEMKMKAASLKRFAEAAIDRIQTVPEIVDEPMDAASDDMETTDEPQAESAIDTNDDTDWEHVTSDEVRPLFASDDEDEESARETQEPEPLEDTVMVQPDEAPLDGVDEDSNNDNEDPPEAMHSEVEQKCESTQANADGDRASDNDSDSLPVWRPYYQIQKRADGVYLVVNLRGVDPRNIHVQAMPQQGALRIVGVKYPTHKDLLLSQLSGAPTFGRFEIVEQFPTRALHLEEASQQLTEDGSLVVRLPFYFVHHPRVMRRVSPFLPHLVAW